MEKCLVTTLKAVVNNNNLPFYDGFVFNLHSSETGDLTPMNTNQDLYIKILEGDGSLYKIDGVNLGREVTTKLGIRYQSPTGDIGKILVKSKYDIKNIKTDHNITAEINLDDLKYMTNLEKFSGSKFIVKGSIDVFKNISGISVIMFNGVNCTGDISVFKDKVDMITLNISGYTSVLNITGDITTLYSLVNATSINLAHIPNIYGSYETLLENMYKNGRISGTMVNYFGPKCSFNNQPISGNNKYEATFSDSGVSVSKDRVVVGTYNGTEWSYM